MLALRSQLPKMFTPNQPNLATPTMLVAACNGTQSRLGQLRHESHLGALDAAAVCGALHDIEDGVRVVDVYVVGHVLKQREAVLMMAKSTSSYIHVHIIVSAHIHVHDSVHNACCFFNESKSRLDQLLISK